jgi:hypothetical protein
MPLDRVAAARPPSAPAHAHRSRRAAYIAPTDNAKNSASVYTADKNSAVGKNATSITVLRA